MEISKQNTLYMGKEPKLKLSEAFVLNTSIQSINQNLVITNKNNKDYV